MALISLEGMEFYGYHGVHKHERETGCSYEVDVYLYTSLSFDDWDDDLSKTLDYETAYNLCLGVMQENHNLLETLCHLMIERISKSLQNLEKIEVKVSKLAPPLKGRVKRSFVMLEKSFES